MLNLFIRMIKELPPNLSLEATGDAARFAIDGVGARVGKS